MARLEKRDYKVEPVSLLVAQRLVREHHYTRGGSNSGTFVHGLIRRADPLEVLGVAWWIPPTRDAAEATYDGDWRRVLALSRLVILPEVPANAASFLIARSTRMIERDGRFECLVTYADEWRGHTGAIYRAAGWEYVGLTSPEATFVDEDDRLVARKAGPRTRTRAEMAELGYRCVGSFAKHKFRKVLQPRLRPVQLDLMEDAA